jgi:hypothetical protein
VQLQPLLRLLFQSESGQGLLQLQQRAPRQEGQLWRREAGRDEDLAFRNLGANFGSGEIEGIVFTFEPSATQAQVDAATKVLTHIYPMKPKQVVVARAPILWEKQGKTAHAKLGNGEGEVFLTQVSGPNGRPVVINNLKYWGADRNKGFNLYKSVHHYKGHGYDYSFKDANGFTIEIEAGSPRKS